MKNRMKLTGDQAEKLAMEALDSLEGITRATANPFLYTRVVARLESRAGGWENMARWLSRPAFAMGSLAIFLTINIGVILWGQHKAENDLVKKLNSEQMLASEFMNTQNYQLVDINE